MSDSQIGTAQDKWRVFLLVYSKGSINILSNILAGKIGLPNTVIVL